MNYLIQRSGPVLRIEAAEAFVDEDCVHPDLARQALDHVGEAERQCQSRYEGLASRKGRCWTRLAGVDIESLDLKSIDIVMILTAIEEKFDVYIPMDGAFQEAKTVQDLVDAAFWQHLQTAGDFAGGKVIVDLEILRPAIRRAREG